MSVKAARFKCDYFKIMRVKPASFTAECFKAMSVNA